MMHLQAHLGKTSKTTKSMWTSISLACTRLHAGIPCSHVQTWYIGSSCALSQRRWNWVVLASWRLIPSGHKIMNRCIRCRCPWSPWRHPSTYPTTIPTPEIYWRTGWRSWLNLGWHPTKYIRWRYYIRHINTSSSLYVACMAKRAQKPYRKVRRSHWTNWPEKAKHATGLTRWLTRWRNK